MHRSRQFEACRTTAQGFSFDFRSARIAKAEQFCGLVEGLSDGIVLRGAEAHIVPDAAHGEDLRVTAGSEEQAIRKRRIVGQPCGQGMRFKVIDGDQRLVFHKRYCLRRCQPDDDPADQSRTAGGRDPVDGVIATIGLRHSSADDAVQHLDMSSRGDFGHHTAKCSVFTHLREDHVG